MRRPLRSPTLVVLPLLLLLSAAVSMVAGCGGTEENRARSWAYISTAIVEPSCATANCHSAIAERSGVVLDTAPHGWEALVCRHWVIPSNPGSSGLLSLLRGQGTRRMPPDFPLANDDVQLIQDWIAMGAAYSGPGTQPCTP